MQPTRSGQEIVADRRTSKKPQEGTGDGSEDSAFVADALRSKWQTRSLFPPCTRTFGAGRKVD
ncbi:hypothetical protein AWENTII_010242 [Aspergillus wentii]